MKAQVIGPLVQVPWLKQNLNQENIIILDATLPKAVVGNVDVGVSNSQIPGARFFDIKKNFSKVDAPFPNTRVEEKTFNEKAKDLGINNDSLIVVYDDHGIYSSARAWWMFRSMGHHSVAVLDGGLKAWIEAGYDLEEKIDHHYDKGNFDRKYDPKFFRDSHDVLALLGDEEKLVVDARAAERFEGLVAEPRKGLRSGHIPNSINVPYTTLLHNGKMKSKEEIQFILNEKLSKDKDAIFSCGSGITACVLALGAVMIGYQNLSIYDGSWTEWGSIESLPIEIGKT